MNQEEVVRQAVKSTVPYRTTLGAEILHKLELAYVAQWLFDQDDSVRELATVTALVAMGRLKARHLSKTGDAPTPKRPRTRPSSSRPPSRPSSPSST